MPGFSTGASPFGQEEMSLPARLLGVFLSPRRSFAAVAGRESAHDWLLPALLACLVGLAAHQLTVDLVTDLERPEVRQHLEGLGQAERERYEQGMQVVQEKGWMMVPVGVFSSLVVVGALLLLFTRSLFSKEVTYRQMLVVKGYASMVMIPEWIVRTALMRATDNPEVHTSPAALLSEAASRSFAGRVLAGMNLFDLWQVVVMGVGIATLAGARLRRVLLGLLILWGVWVFGGAALERSGPPGGPAGGPAPAETPAPAPAGPPPDQGL
ncbi:MAG: YIP1 family protein [Candidatus Latescibacterota bacterium]